MKERRYDIDWLRIVAIIAVFLLHSTHFFDEGTDWHVQNKDQSIAVLVFRGLINIWVMELFFLLSGAASWFSLKSKSGGQYLLERVKRIFVPMYTVGIFVLLPPTLYFTLVTNRGFTGTFWQMYPTYLNNVISYGFNIKSPFLFGIWPGHLWFLQFLFIMSVVLLPLLLFLRSERGHRLVSWLAGVCTSGRDLFVPDSTCRSPHPVQTYFYGRQNVGRSDLLRGFLFNRVCNGIGRAFYRRLQETRVAWVGAGASRLRRYGVLCFRGGL